MLIKLEGLKGNFAAFDQVFEDAAVAFDRYEELISEGWQVEWINIPMNKGEYFDKLNAELQMSISDIFQGSGDGTLN